MASLTITASAVRPSVARQTIGRSRQAVAPSRAPLLRLRHLSCQAAKEDSTVQLTEDERRWESQVRDGRVKNVSARDAGELIKDDWVLLDDGWVLLDVRPDEERNRVRLLGAVEVPVFVTDTEASLSSFIKHATAFGMGGWWLGGSHMATAFGMGGWWLGGSHMVPNPNFMNEVLSQVPKDSRVVVACQKGLRSLAACETLSRAGYGQLAWINGGFDTAKPGDLPTKDDKDLRLAGIGGLSEVLGWNQVQREASKTQGAFGGYENLLKVAIGILILDLTWFGVELFQAYQNNNIPGQ
ncbi:hypothetical protein N2152v2_002575 [Parachlorella kessleri]